LILKRYPNGIAQAAFHQHTIQKPPEFVDTYVHEKEDGTVTYAICNNVASLLYIANLGAIALHMWSARKTSPDKPDWIVFDLDPGQAPFEQVLEVAMQVKDLLGRLELECYAKTSGSKGLHVYVPIKTLYSHDQVVQFATLVAHLAASEHPDLIAVERMVKKRKEGRVYLDYLQNGSGKSLAGPYSVRARVHATVSAPLDWKEVKSGRIEPQDFTIKSLAKRIAKKGDLFIPVLKKRQGLGEALNKIEEFLTKK
jgi:bifunctional non-homologous end joining protein LigD